MSDENAQTRAELIAALGLKLSAKFVPQSVSRNRDEKRRSLNWLVTIEGRGTKLETDYMQGIGHVPHYNEPGTNPRLRASLADEEIRNAQTNASESGKYPVEPFGRRWGLTASAMRPLPEPKLEDVLYSLVLDAGARDYTFEEWANEYGYDTDSRRAEASYRAGVDIGAKLVRVVGGSANLERLSNLFQGF